MSRIFWLLMLITAVLLTPIFTGVPSGVKFALWLLASFLIVLDLLWIWAVAQARLRKTPVSIGGKS